MTAKYIGQSDSLLGSLRNTPCDLDQEHEAELTQNLKFSQAALQIHLQTNEIQHTLEALHSASAADCRSYRRLTIRIVNTHSLVIIPPFLFFIKI